MPGIECYWLYYAQNSSRFLSWRCTSLGVDAISATQLGSLSSHGSLLRLCSPVLLICQRGMVAVLTLIYTKP